MRFVNLTYKFPKSFIAAAFRSINSAPNSLPPGVSDKRRPVFSTSARKVAAFGRGTRIFEIPNEFPPIGKVVALPLKNGSGQFNDAKGVADEFQIGFTSATPVGVR